MGNWPDPQVVDWLDVNRYTANLADPSANNSGVGLSNSCNTLLLPYEIVVITKHSL